MSVSSVCIYCGSANGVSDDFVAIARDVATALAKQKKRIVYGGGHVGLMGVVADTALREGTEVIGIIPEHIRAKEVQHTGLTKLHVVTDMHTRKRMMVEHADAFVILPGGLGTLDEAFEIITWKKLGLHNKPIIIFNHRGFWDPLLTLIDHLIATKFALDTDDKLFSTVTSVSEMLAVLAEKSPQKTATLTERM